jgi:hypothetical protein
MYFCFFVKDTARACENQPKNCCNIVRFRPSFIHVLRLMYLSRLVHQYNRDLPLFRQNQNIESNIFLKFRSLPLFSLRLITPHNSLFLYLGGKTEAICRPGTLG